MIQLPSNPQSVGQVLSSSVSLYQATFKSLIPYALISGCIQTITQFNEVEWTYQLFWLIISFLILNLGIYRLHRLVIGENKNAPPPNLVNRQVAACIAFMIYLVFVLLGLCLFILPGIILSVALYFFPFLIMTGEYGALTSLKESYDLVNKHFIHTATIISIPTLVYFPFVPLYFMPNLNKGVELSIWFLVNTFVMSLFLVITYACMRDLQLRKSQAKSK